MFLPQGVKNSAASLKREVSDTPYGAGDCDKSTASVNKYSDISVKSCDESVPLSSRLYWTFWLGQRLAPLPERGHRRTLWTVGYLRCCSKLDYVQSNCRGKTEKARYEETRVTNSNTSLYSVTVDSSKRHCTPLITWGSAPNRKAHAQCKFAL
jgi:hypothetical protein